MVQNFQTDYPIGNVLTICNSSPPSWNLDLIKLVLVFFGKLRSLSINAEMTNPNRTCYQATLLTSCLHEPIPEVLKVTSNIQVKMQAYSANGFFKPECHQTARNTMQGKTEVFESYISMDYFITWLCDNYLFRHLLTYLLTYFSYLSLFLYFFISSLIHPFISLFVCFFIVLFLYIFLFFPLFAFLFLYYSFIP